MENQNYKIKKLCEIYNIQDEMKLRNRIDKIIKIVYYYMENIPSKINPDTMLLYVADEFGVRELLDPVCQNVMDYSDEIIDYILNSSLVDMYAYYYTFEVFSTILNGKTTVESFDDCHENCLKSNYKK